MGRFGPPGLGGLDFDLSNSAVRRGVRNDPVFLLVSEVCTSQHIGPGNVILA